jgi:hypothetical protein
MDSKTPFQIVKRVTALSMLSTGLQENMGTPAALVIKKDCALDKTFVTATALASMCI